MSQNYLVRFFIGVKERERLCSVLRCLTCVAPDPTPPSRRTAPPLKPHILTLHESVAGLVTFPISFCEIWKPLLLQCPGIQRTSDVTWFPIAKLERRRHHDAR
jgi:hypothetical protein